MRLQTFSAFWHNYLFPSRQTAQRAEIYETFFHNLKCKTVLNFVIIFQRKHSAASTQISFASKKVVPIFLKEIISTNPPADTFEKKTFVVAVQVYGMSSLFFVQILTHHGRVKCL